MNIFSPALNLFVHLSGACSTIRDPLSDFAIATFNYLAQLLLDVVNSNWGGSTANLGLIPKRISEGDFP